ncbi:unnamed protein product [Oncorhynchus mykiss]|uniref:Sleeping Beauty transposase HTH domain-containing protein n=1 Tax=Oncorhynchus mykiss TaxID=8022 RepID=A0A060YMQ4_ONCMY|nr:unnamed protein product [Oncorhynchus mykiss]
MGNQNKSAKTLGKQIVDLHKSGSSLGVISKCLKVPRSSLQTIVRKYKHHGTTQPFTAQEGDIIMLWGCFAAGGTGALHKIDGIMRQENYVDILKQHLKTSVRKLKLGRKWVFQMDDDPKHTSKVVAKWLKDNKVKVLESLGLPIKNMADDSPHKPLKPTRGKVCYIVKDCSVLHNIAIKIGITLNDPPRLDPMIPLEPMPDGVFPTTHR